MALTFSLTFCVESQATLLRRSQIVGFNTGNLGTSGVGDADGWGNSTSQVTVTNGAGSLDGTSLGLVSSAGDRVFISATEALNARNQFVPGGTYPAASTDTNLYFSFLYKFNNAADVSPDGEIIIRMNTGTSGTGNWQHWDLMAKNVGGQIQLGLSKASGVTNYATTNINIGETFFVVVRQHLIIGAQNDVYDLWINPPPASFGADEGSLPPVATTVGAITTDGTENTGSGPGRFVVAAGANSEFDEFRAATTWAEVTPPVGSCNAAGIAMSPTNVTQVAEISATFYSQADPASTAPTYQWQRSTNAGANWSNIGGATASFYTTPNLPLSANGNQYRVVVQVNCDGSSATSSVASVTLTAPTVTATGTIMNDTFTDPELGFDDRANEPLTSTNSLWYTAVTDNLIALGGNMLGTPLVGSSSLWLGYFTETNTPPVHLGVGRSIRVTLPFTPSSYGAHTNNAGLRIGLFDYADSGNRITTDGSTAAGSAGAGFGVRGYMLNLDFGSTFSVNSPLQLLVRNQLGDNNLMGTVNLYESLGSGPAGGGYSNAPAFQAGTQYTLQFTVTRTGENSVNVTAAIAGGGTNWSHSVTETNFAYHRFDAMAIRPNSVETSADSFSFSEFIVEVIAAQLEVAPFSITSVQALSANSVKLTWASQAGASYHIVSSPTATTPSTSWTTNATVLATGSSTSYTNTPTSGAERFYRVIGLPYTP